MPARACRFRRRYIAAAAGECACTSTRKRKIDRLREREREGQCGDGEKEREREAHDVSSLPRRRARCSRRISRFFLSPKGRLHAPTDTHYSSLSLLLARSLHYTAHTACGCLCLPARGRHTSVCARARSRSVCVHIYARERAALSRSPRLLVRSLALSHTSLHGACVRRDGRTTMPLLLPLSLLRRRAPEGHVVDAKTSSTCCCCGCSRDDEDLGVAEEPSASAACA